MTAAGAAPQERQLGEQQLVERQAPPAGLVVAEVRGLQRRRQVRQRLGHAQRGGQRLDRVGDPLTVLAHQRQQLRGRDSLGHRVVRHLALRAQRLGGQRVRLDAEAVAPLVLAVQDQVRARAVLLHQPGLVEERSLGGSGLVGHGGLHQRAHAAPADGAGANRPHLHHHRGRVARHERPRKPKMRNGAVR